MATNPSSLPENVGRITAPNAAYPYGSAKDDSSGTTGDGTPIKKAMLNDTYGFFQAAMQAAGITPSGDAETAETSQVLQALLGVCGGIADKKQWPTIANGVDVDHDIVFSAGKMPDSTGTRPIVTAGITKQIDGAWAAGNSTGGLFTGTAAGSTTYHCFLIVNDVDGTVDAGFDTSPIAANRPAGYTFFRRVASIVTGSGALLRAFVQKGDDFYFTDEVEPVVDIFGGDVAGGAVLVDSGAPKGLGNLLVRQRWILVDVMVPGGDEGANTGIYAGGDAFDLPSSANSNQFMFPSVSNAEQVPSVQTTEAVFPVGVAAQVQYRSRSYIVEIHTLRAWTLGWIDDRSE